MLEEKKSKKKSKIASWVGQGVAVLAMILALTIPSIQGPRNKAEVVSKTVKIGMTADRVLEFVNDDICIFYIKKDDERKNVTKKEFFEIMYSAADEDDIRGIISMNFSGPINRTNVSIVFGSDGKVESVTEPHTSSWDRLEKREK